MSFDPDLFRSEMDKAQNIAEGIRTATPVKAAARKQGNVDILVAGCPHCRTVAALSGEGKHLCRGCHNWLDYKREG
jgi:hypothetical protein